MARTLLHMPQLVSEKVKAFFSAMEQYAGILNKLHRFVLFGILQWHVSWIFIQLNRTVIPCNVLPLMATLSGHNSKHSVHTVFTNKHMNAFDMWFKLIGLPTHPRVIKHNHCGPAATFSPCILFLVIETRFFPSKIYCIFGLSSPVSLDLAVSRPRTTGAIFSSSLSFISVLLHT